MCVFVLVCVIPPTSSLPNQGSRVQPAIQEKKSIHDSESRPVVQQKTHIRLIMWSKPIGDSEGRTPLL